MANINLELLFTMELQEMDLWCWAAAGKSVSFFYLPRTTWSQCKIATAELRNQQCCNRPSACDQSWELHLTLQRTGNYVDLIAGPVQWRELKSEFTNGRLVCARIRWDSGGGHYVAIYGVQKIGSARYVYVDDPITGKAYLRYERFLDNYLNDGSWSHTYHTTAGAAPN